MKNILTIIFLSVGLQTVCQTSIDSIMKIEIVDYVNIDFSYIAGRTYELFPESNVWYIYNLNKFSGSELLNKLKDDDFIRYEKIQMLISDSTTRFIEQVELLHKEYFLEPTKVGCVSKGKIDSLLIELKKNSSKSFALEFSESDLEYNSLTYLDLFLKNHKVSELKETQKDFCIRQLQNLETLNESANTLIRQKGFSDYKYVKLKVISTVDTTEYRTKGTNYYLLPWFNMSNQTATYNPNISYLIGSIIPNDLNGNLLKGGNFKRDLYFYVIEEFCLTRQNRFKKK